MSLLGIISISGRPGIFKIIAQGKQNVIVESLLDKKRFPAYATERISALEEISIFTLDGDIKLTEVYKKMLVHYKGAKSIGHKEGLSKLVEELRIFVPDFDEEKVYASDIKKLFQWYNLLIDQGLLELEKEEKEEKSAKKEPTKKSASKAKTTTKKTTSASSSKAKSSAKETKKPIKKSTASKSTKAK
jgi:hypothetical protein